MHNSDKPASQLFARPHEGQRLGQGGARRLSHTIGHAFKSWADSKDMSSFAGWSGGVTSQQSLRCLVLSASKLYSFEAGVVLNGKIAVSFRSQLAAI